MISYHGRSRHHLQFLSPRQMEIESGRYMYPASTDGYHRKPYKVSSICVEMKGERRKERGEKWEEGKSDLTSEIPFWLNHKLKCDPKNSVDWWHHRRDVEHRIQRNAPLHMRSQDFEFRTAISVPPVSRLHAPSHQTSPNHPTPASNLILHRAVNGVLTSGSGSSPAYRLIH